MLQRSHFDPHMEASELVKNRKSVAEPSFTLRNRLERVFWNTVHFLFIRFSPPQAHKYRVCILKMFGAQISWKAHVYPSASIWIPRNLTMEDYAVLGRNVRCYNIAPVRIERQATVSQGTHLCTGTHDYCDPMFQLYSKAIIIKPLAWICADSFVGPGVTVGEGAVLGATGTAFKDLRAWTVYAGNPAQPVKDRPVLSGA